MKRSIKTLCLSVCCVAISVTVWAGSEKSVQVRKGQVRQQPSFLAQVIKDLPYGERVEVISKNTPWLEIRDATGSTGWMHASALTSKRLKLRKTGGAVSSPVTQDEVALAGKGFTQALENTSKTGNSSLEYIWLDRMEQIVITPSEIEQFLHTGGIRSSQGGA